MGENKQSNIIASNRINQIQEETEQPALVKKIGGTTFDIHVYFSETSKETFTDKVLRLIQNDDATT